MTRLPALVETVARLDGRPEKSINWYARKAREEGKISSTKRGRGSSHMTLTDAVNLLLATNCADEAIDGPRVIDQMRSLGRAEQITYPDQNSEPYRRIARSQNLGEALEQLMTQSGAITNLFFEAYKKYMPGLSDEEARVHMHKTFGIDVVLWRFGAEIVGWSAPLGKRDAFFQVSYNQNLSMLQEGFYEPQPSRLRKVKVELSLPLICEVASLVLGSPTGEGGT